MARIEERGLQYTYGELIREAFQPSLWESGELVEGEFTQAESNFSLFWGLALQADQTTLISNGSPFDRFQEGSAGALTAQEQEGMRLFQTTGRCSTCHSGAEFSAATYSNNGGRGNNRAFHRTGVRDAVEDAGAGNGSFKSIGLRNVELTGPYFHNGGQATLEQVIEFYARGGDFGNNAIRPFNMSSTQKASLAAFLRALTDERVRFERAPFDQPELCVPAGHVELRPGVLIAALAWQYPRSSLENWAGLAAVGGGGTRDAVADFRGDAGGHRGRWVTGQCDERGVCGALAMMGGVRHRRLLKNISTHKCFNWRAVRDARSPVWGLK